MKRIQELDAVRGLAALAVVIAHLQESARGGRAVDVFFLLSGYLITGIILRNRSQPSFLTTFYIRRGLRIWPIYYLTLAILMLVGPLVLNAHRFDDMGYYLLYLQYTNLYWQGPPMVMDLPLFHTWTLAIEEQFYLIWPAFLIMFGPRWLVPLILACLIASFSARWSGISDWTLLARCDCLVLGAFLAWILSPNSPVKLSKMAMSRLFLAVGMAGLALGGAIVTVFRDQTWAAALKDTSYALLVLGVVGLIVLHAGHRWLWPLRNRWLCFLGLISYGLYLYHVPVLAFGTSIAERYDWSRGLVFQLVIFLASLAIAVVSWYAIEQPILALKDRFGYQPPRVDELPIVSLAVRDDQEVSSA